MDQLSNDEVCELAQSLSSLPSLEQISLVLPHSFSKFDDSYFLHDLISPYFVERSWSILKSLHFDLQAIYSPHDHPSEDEELPNDSKKVIIRQEIVALARKLWVQLDSVSYTWIEVAK